jgi:hypothetical protein
MLKAFLHFKTSPSYVSENTPNEIITTYKKELKFSVIKLNLITKRQAILSKYR